MNVKSSEDTSNMGCCDYIVECNQKKQWEDINQLLMALHSKSNVLNAAIENGAPLDIVTQLMTPTNINMHDPNGYTILHLAVLKKRWDVVSALLEQGARIDDWRLRLENTPLFLALQVEAPEAIVRQLISREIINLQGGAGGTVLHVTLRLKRWDIVPVLIDHGADIEAWAPPNYDTPLHVALRSDAPDDIIRQLTSSSIHDVQDIHGRTPLHWAIGARRQTAFVNDMISSENINTIDVGGFTPLWLAVILDYWEYVPVLMDHGADVNILDKDQRSVLHRAVDFALPPHIPRDLVRLISPLNINIEHESDGTPLHVAVTKRHWPLVHLLLQHGADPYRPGLLPPPPLSLQGLCIAAVRGHMREKSDAAYQGLGLVPPLVLPELRMEPQAKMIVATHRPRS